MELDTGDPFSCFGDSSDEEQEEFEKNESSSLVHQVNQRISSKREKQQHESSQPDESIKEGALIPLESELNLWPESPPLYLGSIRLVASLSNYGGGRGYVATQNIEAGTLVLVEEPMIQWPSEQLGKALDLVSVRHILEQPNANDLIRDLEEFHPTKRAVDQCKDSDEIQVQEMIESIETKHKEQLEDLMHFTKRLHLNISTTTELARIYCVLRYNGLDSGVYRHVAMLNHDDFFNCVKFQPTNGKSYSEVRTTRFVKVGDSLTISYLPNLVSHASRRQHLWDQHRFDIGENLREDQVEFEVVNGKVPKSSIHYVDESSVTFHIESAVSELESLLEDVATLISMQTPQGAWEQAQALELSALELCHEAKNQLQNDKHVLLLRCHQLHSETCNVVLQNSHLERDSRILLLIRLVSTNLELRELQLNYYGGNHFGLGRTFLDLAQGIQELLVRAPKKLFASGLQKMTSFEQCSAIENDARREYERIQSLYPHDADKKINAAAI